MNSLSISQLGKVNSNYATQPKFKGNNTNLNGMPVEDYKMQGANLAATYNKGIINVKKDLDIKPVKMILNDPTDIDSIEGEKILTSEGKIYSITTEDEDAQTIYSIENGEDENSSDMISNITVIDQTTGNKIKTQGNVIKDGIVYSHVTEYSPETGEEEKSSYYENGKILHSSKSKTMRNGEKLEIGKYYDDKTYSVWTSSELGNAKHNSWAKFDSNKNLVSAEESVDDGMKSRRIEAQFYNGEPISVSKNESITIPNTLAADKIGNPELVPADKFIPDRDYKSWEGEKKYYSNGALEQNIVQTENGELACTFSPDGDLIKVVSEDKEITINKDEQTIIEKQGDQTKTTEYYSNGGFGVRIERDGLYKELGMSKDNKPTHYEEGIANGQNNISASTSLWFNEKGMLENTYSF